MNPNTQPSLLDRYGAFKTILCCPMTQGPLRLVGIDELLSHLSDVERKRMSPDTIGAFISDARGRAYPVTERVADFLEQDSLAIENRSLTGVPIAGTVAADDGIKRSVKDWYDQFGWKKNDSGSYIDTAIFSQSAPAGHGLYEMMSHLAILDRLKGGEFVLDAASGAIPHPEYLSFSWFFKTRVCVDMSSTGLVEAHAKLRPSDFCCMADICHLPFRNETFDGVVSGYTIQHIPESQQIPAIKELYRVLKPDTHLCILTETQTSASRDFLLRILNKLSRMFRPVRPAPPANVMESEKNPPHPLYCQLRTLAWWKTIAGELTKSHSAESLRIFSKSEFENFFEKSNRAAKWLRIIESVFPHWTANLSIYCLIDIYKPFE